MSSLTIGEIKKLLRSSAGPEPEVLAALEQDPRQGAQALLASYRTKELRLREERARLHLLYNYERQLAANGYSSICGVDEAGRGPLAGPMVVAGVILPPEAFLPGLNDSKKLSSAAREKLYEKILRQALAVQVAVVSVATIDRLNIYQAAKQGFKQVIERLDPRPAAAITDAMPLDFADIKVLSLIHGDALSASVAAASIIAKVTRDRLMLDLDKLYPLYGFAKHKGYGSKEHMEALARFGPCPQHRRSFEPVRSMYVGPAEFKEDVLYSPLAGQYRTDF